MAEYIEREKLEKAFDDADPDVCESYPDGYSDWGFGRKNIRDVIRSVPAADVAPVVQGREPCEGGTMMDINKFIDNQMAAWARNDMIGMLADVGQALWGTGLKFSGAKYRSVLVGQLMVNAAAALEECWKREGLIQAEAKPEHPGDVVVKVTVPDRWPMTEAGQRRAAQEAAAQKPMTNGDRIRAMTDEELAESDELLSGLCNVLHGQGYPCEANTCRECLIKWLGSPEKEAAPEPVTNGDRIRDRKDGELTERERLERLFEEARQIADRRAWDETSRTMADICGQEANDGQ